MFNTYILYSQSTGLFYAGHSSDLQRRLVEHNRGKTSFMKKGMPWVLIYSIEFRTRSEAMVMESTIKKRGAARFLSDNNIEVG
jgi:putative endonuclease